MMEKQNYSYDVFGESDVHCKECKFVRSGYNLSEIFCAITGRIVQKRGYCRYAEKQTDEKEIAVFDNGEFQCWFKDEK